MLYPLSYGGQRPSKRSRPAGHEGISAAAWTTLPGVSETLRVLVVDDDPVIRRLIKVNLDLEGFEVTEAVDGRAALDAVAEQAPDVVVLDVAMPRLDGLATTAALRSDPATSDIKIVIVSARAQQADVRRGIEAGADAYLTKPFEPEALIRCVRELAETAATKDAPLR